jgi:hypothetical protein
MMLYVLLPRGDLAWDDLRLFTSFAHVESLVTTDTYILAFEGTDELTPVWIYQLEHGKLRRYPISR